MKDSVEDIISTMYPEPRQKFIQLCLKRILDCVISLILIVIALPLLVTCIIAIKLESRGSALFLQYRVGLFGREFAMLKLRTMYEGSQQPRPTDGHLLKLRSDPRITRIGRLLRITSLDELPQLFNVLAGQMSLVGPRPLVPHMLAPYRELALVRSRVRPGITGLWQIRDRAHATHVSFMAEHDLEYVKRFSLWLDLMILLKTPWCVIFGKGAQ
jgi:exopolysaccharide production protein ExoY